MRFPINDFDLLKIQQSRGWFLFAIGSVFWKQREYSALFQIMRLQGKWTVELLYYRLFERAYEAIRKAQQ